MGSSPWPGSCRGPRGVQVARSELSWNFRLLCAFLQGPLLCPTCSGDGESCFAGVFFFLLALGVFFLPTRLAVFCRLLLWARASRGDVWASRPRASCCWLPLGQVWGKLRHRKAARPPLQNHWGATGRAQPELMHQAQAQGHGDEHGAAASAGAGAPPGSPPPCGSVFWVTEHPRGSCCAPLGVVV